MRAAFTRHPDEVALLVEKIRASPNYVPELALVAESDSGVTGFVMVSWVGVEGGARDQILNLSPLAVHPDRQRGGIGIALTEDVLRRAEALGEPTVVVEGIPPYYPRFGFERASALGFRPDHEGIPDQAFMVKRLPGYRDDLAGRIVYPEAFHHLSG